MNPCPSADSRASLDFGNLVTRKSSAAWCSKPGGPPHGAVPDGAQRVANLVQRLAVAEVALAAAEDAIKHASAALGDLRRLAEQGGAKVAP
jgi:hypothetical protein